jgi:uncharacterized protein (TIGR02246 family)
MAQEMTVALATEFAEAWNTHDPDKVVSYFSEDGAFHSPIGPEHLGASHHGKKAIREAVAAFFARSPNGQFKNLRVHVFGDFGVFEWDFEEVDANGRKTSVAGCDILKFKGDKIHSKSVFRKQPVPAGKA